MRVRVNGLTYRRRSAHLVALWGIWLDEGVRVGVRARARVRVMVRARARARVRV